ncbi:MAG: amino acid--[acyl-carrier-protein] ligase [Pseudomonadota bacterium]|nr:amino acid--[acyl-carrier-protein] ligase [Pseudomonadota bacterium]
MSKTYDVQTFYNELVEHGLIIPTGVAGVFGRSAVFESIVEAFNNTVSRLCAPDQPERLSFPPIVSRKVIEKVHYLESFPHLCGAVHSFFGTELGSKELAAAANEGREWGQMLKMTDVCLTPAICYPVYPTATGVLPADGRLVDVLGWAYRHEPSPEPTRLQSFRMRELIRMGSGDQVVEWRNLWLQRGLDLLRSLGLNANSDVASDPFFGRGGKVLSKSQKEQRLKFEVLVPVISAENPTAVCSFNFHQEHFGSTFEIRQSDGRIANTACLGFGLERVTMALLKEHGFDPGKWPSEARGILWP